MPRRPSVGEAPSDQPDRDTLTEDDLWLVANKLDQRLHALKAAERGNDDPLAAAERRMKLQSAQEAARWIDTAIKQHRDVTRMELLRALTDMHVHPVIYHNIASTCERLGVTMLPQEAFAEHRLTKEAQAAAATCTFHEGMGGGDFLHVFAQHQRASLQLAEDHELTMGILTSLVKRHCGGEKAAALLPLLVVLLKGDTHRLDLILRAKCLGQRAAGDGAGKFLDHVKEFLEMFADVTAEVLRHRRSSATVQVERLVRMIGEHQQGLPDSSDDFLTRFPAVDKFLQTIFHDPLLVSDTPTTSNTETNLYTISAGHLNDFTEDGHPWLWNSLDGTIFDPGKVSLVLSREIPREALAGVLTSLNNLTEIKRLEPAKRLLRRYIALRLIETHNAEPRVYRPILLAFKEEMAAVVGKMQVRVKTRDPRNTRSEEEWDKRIYAGKAVHWSEQATWEELMQCYQALQKIDNEMPEGKQEERLGIERHNWQKEVDAYFKDEPALQEEAVTGKGTSSAYAAILREHIEGAGAVSDYAETIAMPGGGPPVHADHILLRMIDAKSIGEEKELEKDFVALLRRMSAQPQDMLDNPILAQSMTLVLEQTDPYLDRPLEHCSKKENPWSGKSIREILVAFCKQWFSSETLKSGHPKLVSSLQKRPVFTMTDAERDPARLAALKKNFDVARIGVPHPHIEAEAAKLLEGRGDKGYAFADRFLQDTCSRFHGSRDYRYFAYPNATAAFDSFRAHFFPSLEKGAYCFIDEHAYDVFTQHIEKARGDADPKKRIEVINFNRRFNDHSGVPLRTDDVLRQMEMVYLWEEEVPPKMLLWERATRLGEAPLSGPHGNLGATKALFNGVKSRWPDTIVAMDGSQAVGRTGNEHLDIMRPDVAFYSASKMGAGDVAYMACHKSLLDPENPDRFHYIPSTMPEQKMVQLALLQERLMSTYDRTRMEGNFTGKSMLENCAQHYARLTEYAIAKAGTYAERFMRETKVTPDMHPSLANIPEDKWPELFSCRVSDPLHRNPADMTGILTLHFPNISAAMLSPHLQKVHGMKTSVCRFKNRALRVSFHYQHDEGDIDELFAAIRASHRYFFLESCKNKEKPIRAQFDLNELKHQN